MNDLLKAFRAQKKYVKFCEFLDSLSEEEYNELTEEPPSPLEGIRSKLELRGD